jgi:hypothetical protein
LLQSHSFKNHTATRNLFFHELSGGGILESKKSKIPEPKMTSKGKFRCTADNKEYDTREDYDEHCREEHAGGW